MLKRFASGARRVGSKESQEAGRADAIVGQRAVREGRASALTTGQSREAARKAYTKHLFGGASGLCCSARHIDVVDASKRVCDDAETTEAAWLG